MVVHDFSGHPFQVQLARHLATRGHTTSHLYCPSFQTPRGKVDAELENGFESVGVVLRKPFAKYSWRRRFVHESEYGLRLARHVWQRKPDVVISANTPLVAALIFQIAMRIRRIPVVFWQQDIYSAALVGHLSRENGAVGRFVGNAFVRIEGWLLRSSSSVVVISEDFLDNLARWRVPAERIEVIENWAPLEELPVRERPNEWSRAHGIGDDDVVFLYAGTLGLKHQPSLLLDIARTFADRDDVRVLVASEGLGATWLDEQREGDEVALLPFQPFESLPDMFATADVLLVLLEPDAGVYSVPSKVLSYTCAGRSILGSMPPENLASRNITSMGIGLVAGPGDSDAFVAHARTLADDALLRRSMGDKARDYAERAFDIDSITDRFEALLRRSTRRMD